LGGGEKQGPLLLFTLWLLLGLGAIAFTRYQPTRYFLIVYPALAALAAHTVWQLPALLRKGRCRLIALPLVFLVHHLLAPLAYRIAPNYHDKIAFVVALVGVFCMTLLPSVGGGRKARNEPLGWRGKRWREELGWREKRREGWLWHTEKMPRVLIGLFLLYGMAQFTHAMATRTYQTQTISRQLAELTPPGSLIAGDWACNLCLDNDRRVAPVLMELANSGDPLRTLKPDYVLLGWYPKAIDYWNRVAPGLLRDENHVASFNLHGYPLRLYKVTKP
jgi:hypothetical protein